MTGKVLVLMDLTTEYVCRKQWKGVGDFHVVLGLPLVPGLVKVLSRSVRDSDLTWSDGWVLDLGTPKVAAMWERVKDQLVHNQEFGPGLTPGEIYEVFSTQPRLDDEWGGGPSLWSGLG